MKTKIFNVLLDVNTRQYKRQFYKINLKRRPFVFVFNTNVHIMPTNVHEFNICSFRQIHVNYGNSFLHDLFGLKISVQVSSVDSYSDHTDWCVRSFTMCNAVALTYCTAYNMQLVRHSYCNLHDVSPKPTTPFHPTYPFLQTQKQPLQQQKFTSPAFFSSFSCSFHIFYVYLQFELNEG